MQLDEQDFQMFLMYNLPAKFSSKFTKILIRRAFMAGGIKMKDKILKESKGPIKDQEKMG